MGYNISYIINHELWMWRRSHDLAEANRDLARFVDNTMRLGQRHGLDPSHEISHEIPMKSPWSHAVLLGDITSSQLFILNFLVNLNEITMKSAFLNGETTGNHARRRPQYFPCGHAHHRTLYGRPSILAPRRGNWMISHGKIMGFIVFFFFFFFNMAIFWEGNIMIIDHDQAW